MEKFSKRILIYFDKLEDRIRGWLSHRPIIYSFIGAFAIVLFWRGVWMTADAFPILTGPVSIIISVAILLSTGLFVSFFVGDLIILSGIKKEKKIVEKTEAELKSDKGMLGEIDAELKRIEALIQEVKEKQQAEQTKQ